MGKRLPSSAVLQVLEENPEGLSPRRIAKQLYMVGEFSSSQVLTVLEALERSGKVVMTWEGGLETLSTYALKKNAQLSKRATERDSAKHKEMMRKLEREGKLAPMPSSVSPSSSPRPRKSFWSRLLRGR